MLHAITITLSAFLLFLVEPILAKQILPWFGGSAGVWTTCLVFFQVVLLAGYAYCDWLVRLKSARAQAWIHCALLAASVAALPLAPSQAYKLHDPAHPVTAILALLFTTVGLPFLVLSTTGPLVQAWRARASRSSRVYRLYALSNAASLTALLAYPLVVEPLTSLRAQSLAWSAGYVAFVACAAACAIGSRHAAPVSPTSGREAPSSRPSRAQQALWFALAALPSVLLLGVTGHITQDVASIPFLWVVPLALYLGTFVLCFDSARAYRPVIYGSATAVLSVAMVGGQLVPSPNVAIAIPLYLTGLFVTCMFCHGELATRKPDTEHLTRFYLMLSAGGATGGLLVGVVAPLVLAAKLELSLALCAMALLLYLLVPGKRRFVGAAALVVACGAFALQITTLRANAVALSRNFYGTLRVVHVRSGLDDPGRLRLMHGVILHGEQQLEPGRRAQPTAYFGPGSGVAHAIRLLRPGPLRVGIVGMGAGTLSAYGEPGDTFRYYELDPAVVGLARSHFTFLAGSAASTEIVIGDGRLGLERDPAQHFDILVVDAFSSDSVPVHLLTREAVAIYRTQLQTSGLLAIHVTNRHVELAPIVAGVARENGLRAWLVENTPVAGSSFFPSRWVLATADDALTQRLDASPGAHRLGHDGEGVWTDDYSNLLGALRVLHRRAPVPPAIARTASRP